MWFLLVLKLLNCSLALRRQNKSMKETPREVPEPCPLQPLSNNQKSSKKAVETTKL